MDDYVETETTEEGERPQLEVVIVSRISKRECGTVWYSGFHIGFFSGGRNFLEQLNRPM